MQLSTRGRYAVMAMVELAAREALVLDADLSAGPSPCPPVALAEIATCQGLSLAYLEQLFAHLRRAGLVRALRGPGGGYRLAQSAATISVAAVIAAVNERIVATRCTDDGMGCIVPSIAGESARRCRTHDLWAELGRNIEKFLSDISLEDVISGRIPGARTVDPIRHEAAG